MGSQSMVEIADIFREYGAAYCQAHKLPGYILKAINAIVKCRTAELGGHISKCDHCGHQNIFYNSCRNRHCPKCQNLAKERWLLDRKEDLLPVEYFHVVLTIPNQLNALALRNQKEIYDILFKAGSETLLELGKDPKHLGAEIGFITILHTWGQNLMDHPHLHCIVPGGGLALNQSSWISASSDFFIPIKAISHLFRGKFLFYLKESLRHGKLKFTGDILYLNKRQNFTKLMNVLYQEEWVTYCKPPFRNSEQLFEYLGRYTHKVAISNHRIIEFNEGKVTFRWRDYKDDNRIKLMTLDVFEFIRRFLLHILPAGFVKIRHYGILSNRNKGAKFKKCREYLGLTINSVKPKVKLSWEELLFQLTGVNPRNCPVCKQGKMVTHEILNANKTDNIKWLIALKRIRDKLALNGKLTIESP
jgi:hypothetical protein